MYIRVNEYETFRVPSTKSKLNSNRTTPEKLAKQVFQGINKNRKRMH